MPDFDNLKPSRSNSYTANLHFVNFSEKFFPIQVIQTNYQIFNMIVNTLPWDFDNIIIKQIVGGYYFRVLSDDIWNIAGISIKPRRLS